jgi:hypothetical protein
MACTEVLVNTRKLVGPPPCFWLVLWFEEEGGNSRACGLVEPFVGGGEWRVPLGN